MSAWSNTDNQAGKPVVEATTWVIDASSTSVVSAADDTIVVPNGFNTGDALIYTSGGTEIGGLTSGTTYYAIRVGGNTIKLATSAGNAASGTSINLTAVGSETDDTLQALAANLYGVDKNEMAANKTQEGPAHLGWNKVTTKTVGGVARTQVETLVALSKNAFSATDAEDAVFEDYLLAIDTQPSDDSSATGEAVTFTVVASSTPSGASLSYQWQESTDGGSTFSNISAAGVYSDVTTDTLAISDNTGLDTYQYRVVVSATGADDVTSSAATLTEA